ncbi:MAG: aldo/keto reductase [Candidatus Tectomicrobia bacterium]|uniref:Aldo/keto reductase n=1 Tax=Tectimicrobiota bacterium TaxID=2528274 RepID=A0A932MM94_UNCTE|nr:aldo/keto reductase [Candidatus Tectomicrobia bacterium]
MAYPGCATREGTASYRDSLSGRVEPRHFRELQDVWMSSVGIGTYLGEADEAADAAYRASVAEAVRLGCNVIDTSLNYRFQRSERSIGGALADLAQTDGAVREQLVICTKGGYIPFDGAAPRTREEYAGYLQSTYFGPGVCRPGDIVANCHCMTPGFLRHSLEASLRNLGVEAVDVYYVHNPEFQLQEISREVFLMRLRHAFAELERAVEEGKIRCYGTATWNGYRADASAADHLSLDEVLQAALEAGGPGHHFRVVQLPLNLGMPEAFANPNQRIGDQRVSFLAAAARNGITVMTSGSILQGRASRGLPPVVGEVFPGFETDAQRAIQFARSTPGVGVALVGMSRLEHVRENLKVAERPPATFEEFIRLFRKE